MCNGIEKIKCTLMKCHTNVNSTPFTQLPHKFSYIVAILGHNHFDHPIYAVHDYFKHAGGRDIFLLDCRQVLSYDVSFLNIRIVVNSAINLVNKNLPRTALQICMFHFNYNFTIIVPNAFNYLKNVTTWEQCSVEL
jgi:hypothetical protein